MTEVLIGTSGYYYPDWIGPFYPTGSRKEDFLGIYSRQFPFCELNFSYYQMPLRSRLISMMQQTPAGFQFAVKAHKSITHERGPGSAEQAAEFYHALHPILDEGRLAAVLLQFPYSFHHSPENRKYLAGILKPLEGLPLNVEFRNREWMLERVYEGFRERGIGFVQTDNPELDNLPLPTATTTSDTGYIRFHGRNTDNWWSGDNTSRYDYLYSDHELQSWLCRIEDMAKKVKRLLIAFNNHHNGKAVQNAKEIYNLIIEHTELKPAEIKSS
ncbi:MAG TPA: DUF72 domain-containing protein [Spirochaeta sp.]|nr:DUF72 domain-containing protein [Spirochaeta sp.]